MSAPAKKRAQDATLDDTLRVLDGLLAEARYDVERFQGAGSDLDMAEANVARLLLAIDGVINARSSD